MQITDGARGVRLLGGTRRPVCVQQRQSSCHRGDYGIAGQVLQQIHVLRHGRGGPTPNATNADVHCGKGAPHAGRDIRGRGHGALSVRTCDSRLRIFNRAPSPLVEVFKVSLLLRAAAALYHQAAEHTWRLSVAAALAAVLWRCTVAHA